MSDLYKHKNPYSLQELTVMAVNKECFQIIVKSPSGEYEAIWLPTSNAKQLITALEEFVKDE